MHESDLPVGDTDELDDDATAVDEPVEPEVDPAAAAAEAELDTLNDAYDTVDAALKALDGDDLDQAEALAASLGGTSDVATDDAEPESSSEA
ncbi:MAG: hypothetical protein AAGE98_05875 [Actinomycetota bacterium]